MSDKFREKAIKIIVDYSGASADELKSMADADLLANTARLQASRLMTTKTRR